MFIVKTYRIHFVITRDKVSILEKNNPLKSVIRLSH